MVEGDEGILSLPDSRLNPDENELRKKVRSMNEINPDTYCGLYCGACSVAVYGKTGQADNFIACIKGVPREAFSCDGCKSENLYAGCRACGLRRCAREKKVEHCTDCADYPCRSYRAFQKMSKLLPHLRGVAAALESIRRDGAGHWLNAENRRWLCPDCGTPFSWYAAACRECGRSLASEAHGLSAWKKPLCRFMLSMAYRKGKADRKNV